MVVGDPDLPAAVRCRSGDGYVAAQADQDAAAEPTGDGIGAPVCRAGLGGGAEIELRPAGQRGPGRIAVKQHVAPAGHGTARLGRLSGFTALDQGEVTVVAKLG